MATLYIVAGKGLSKEVPSRKRIQLMQMPKVRMN